MKVKDHRNLPEERIEIEQHYGLNQHDALKFLEKGFTVTSENSYYAFRHRSSEEIEEIDRQREKEDYYKQKPMTPDECYSSPFTSDVGEQRAYMKEVERDELNLRKGYLAKDILGVSVSVPASPQGYDLLCKLIKLQEQNKL